ncbi:MAG: hypothetical protein Q9165_008798 [Trypethelium subeluteriae]
MYSRLNPASREIRLIEISPTLDETLPIRCQLHTVSLDTHPEYVALSYVWGNLSDGIKDILVDDKPLSIMSNLFAALKALRDDRFEGRPMGSPNKDISIAMFALLVRVAEFQRNSDSQRETVGEIMSDMLIPVDDSKPTIWFWADAICIDQSNVEERNDQILLMGAIYSQARFTIAWLGPDETGNLKHAFRLLSMVESFGIPGQERITSADWISSHPEFLELEEDTVLFNRYWSLLFELEQLPYWKRMWIIQEITLSRKFVMIAGNEMLNLQTLGMFCNFCNDVRDSRILKPSFVSLRLWSIFKREFNQIRSSLIFRETADLIGDLELNYSLYFIALDHQCRDPRDQIFALHGILKNLNRPDYKKSTTEVYCQHAREWVNETAEMDILLYRGTKSHSDNELRLPSWVPDWQSLSEEGYLSSLRKEFDLGAAFNDLCTHQPSVTLDFKLQCPAVQLGEVESVTRTHRNDLDRLDIIQLHKRMIHRDRYPRGVLLQCLLRAITCDGVLNSRSRPLELTDARTLDFDGSMSLYLALLLILYSRERQKGGSIIEIIALYLQTLGLSDGNGQCTQYFFETFPGLTKEKNWIQPEVWSSILYDQASTEEMQAFLYREDSVIETTEGFLGWARAPGTRHGDMIFAVKGHERSQLVLLRGQNSTYIYLGQCCVLGLNSKKVTELIRQGEREIEMVTII